MVHLNFRLARATWLMFRMASVGSHAFRGSCRFARTTAADDLNPKAPRNRSQTSKDSCKRNLSMCDASLVSASGPHKKAGTARRLLKLLSFQISADSANLADLAQLTDHTGRKSYLTSPSYLTCLTALLATAPETALQKNHTFLFARLTAKTKATRGVS